MLLIKKKLPPDKIAFPGVSHAQRRIRAGVEGNCCCRVEPEGDRPIGKIASCAQGLSAVLKG